MMRKLALLAVAAVVLGRSRVGDHRRPSGRRGTSIRRRAHLLRRRLHRRPVRRSGRLVHVLGDDAHLHRDRHGRALHVRGGPRRRVDDGRGGDGSGGNDIWFDNSEVAHFDGFPDSADYDRDENQQRYEDRAAFLNSDRFWHRGTSYPHPEFADAPFYVHDAGVVVLDDSMPMDTYGRIPKLDYIDRYAGRPHHLFEVVGYGLTKSGPFTEEGGDRRLKGDVKLNTIHSSPPDTYVLLSNNKGVPHPGGTCFGDSGGRPSTTRIRTVLAVTSFGFSSTCTGVGGVPPRPARRSQVPRELRDHPRNEEPHMRAHAQRLDVRGSRRPGTCRGLRRVWGR